MGKSFRRKSSDEFKKIKKIKKKERKNNRVKIENYMKECKNS